ncbi:MAG: carbohydrate-binding module family 20 domain-containing protein, partial [Ignavibacteriaceae bacterium]
MKKFILIILLALLNNSITAQIYVKIIVFAPGLSDTEKVFITGSLNQIGNWNPSAISLDKINDSTFSKSFNFPSNYLVEFKFTK